MYLYLSNAPRTLYLITSSHDERLGRPRRALVFRATDKDSQAVVEFLPKDEVDLGNLVRLSSRIVKGCLGLISIENGEYLNFAKPARSNRLPGHVDIFLAVVTSATEVGNTRPTASSPESVAKIHEVSFYSLTSPTWDDYSAASDGLISPDAIDAAFRDNYSATPGSAPQFEHPCLPLGKILSSGTFYYAYDTPWDLSSRLSVRLSRRARDPNATHDLGNFDERFVWNEYILRSLLDFRARLSEQERMDLDCCQFLVSPSLYFSASTEKYHGRRYWPSKGMSGFLRWDFLSPRRMGRRLLPLWL